MPSLCGINISLVSQPENIVLPEYIDPPNPDKDENGSSKYPTISAYISITKNSQFWIIYSIPSPCPLSNYYYFKMTLADKVVLCWGCGARDGYQGKVMFSLVNDGDCWMRKNTIEKRTFSIVECNKTVSTPETSFLIIAVHRTQGRKRVSRKNFNFQGTSQRMHDVANIQ